jgi:sugar O-acyltransferase (sialic acid O-acetyltransferase NeuD family)
VGPSGAIESDFMLQPLILIGAGGFARETAEAVRAVNSVQPRWDLKGFLDDDPELVGRSFGGLDVIGPIDSVQEHSDAAVVLCTGRPDNYLSRKRIATRIGLPDDRFATVVHPSAAIGTTSSIGVGSVLLSQVSVTADVHIGRHIAIMPQTVLTHDVQVDDWATLASGVLLGGGVQVGEGAYLGSGCSIREGVRIGSWALIGMGSVVTRDVPPGRLWFGSPARDRSAAPVPPSLTTAARRP